MNNIRKVGACAMALSVMSANLAYARDIHCASQAEVSAIQVSAIQQELTDAALACGPSAVTRYNEFQRRFQKELRVSDALMLRMFKRVYGVSKGNAAYDSYKTRAIAHAEQRRTKPGEHDNFCHTADIVFSAALAPDKPVLEDFVSGVPVSEANPVSACQIKVAVSLQGVQTGAAIQPVARPAMPGDDANLFPGGPLPPEPATAAAVAPAVPPVK